MLKAQVVLVAGSTSAWLLRLVEPARSARTGVKHIAAIYSVLVTCSALFAWIDYFANAASRKEHLLPTIMLAVVSWPSSFVVEKLFEWQFVQDGAWFITVLCLLGLLQAAFLWFFAATND